MCSGDPAHREIAMLLKSTRRAEKTKCLDCVCVRVVCSRWHAARLGATCTGMQRCALAIPHRGIAMLRKSTNIERRKQNAWIACACVWCVSDGTRHVWCYENAEMCSGDPASGDSHASEKHTCVNACACACASHVCACTCASAERCLGWGDVCERRCRSDTYITYGQHAHGTRSLRRTCTCTCT